MKTNRAKINSKIFSDKGSPAFQKKLEQWRVAGKKIVFTNGCFDIMHLGHIDYLSKAADMGEVLIVGLNTDASVRKIKGPSRPVNNQSARATVLAALTFVDAIVFFEQDTPIELITKVEPDVLVKGGDYRVDEIVGHEIVKAKNGKVIAVDLVEGYSTSELIKKLTI